MTSNSIIRGELIQKIASTLTRRAASWFTSLHSREGSSIKCASARALNITRAYDGMDAREIFRNQEDFTIADSKKDIAACTAMGHRGTGVCIDAICTKLKSLRSVPRLRTILIIGRSRGGSAARGCPFEEGEKRRSLIFVPAVARCMTYAAGIPDRSGNNSLYHLAEMLRCR